MKSPATALAIVAAGALIGAAILFSGINSASPGANTNRGTEAPVNNVQMVDGVQVVEITARTGYRPGKSVAKAGVPTKVRFITNNNYDCSSSVRIPAIGYQNFLPSTGTTDVDLGTPTAGVLRGTCGMGMYSFEITFK